MNPPWFFRERPKVNGLKRLTQGRAQFVPFLEPLEDRSLLSVIPTVTFIDGTVGQPLPNQSSNIITNYQPSTTSTNDLTITFSIAYSGSAIGFVSYSFTHNLNDFTTIPAVVNGTQLPFAASSGTSNFVTFTGGNQVQSTAWQLIQFQLNLSPTQNEPIATGTSYSVSLSAFDAPGGATLQVTVAGSNASGNATAGPAGLIRFNWSATATPAANNPSGIPDGAPNSGSDWSFSNINGSSAFTITLANLSFFARQDSNSGQVYTAGNAVFTSATDFLRKDLTGPGYNSASVPGYYISTGSPTGSSSIDRRSNANLNSLVVSETSPGFYLTLSITQEISQRSSSPSAQATWTGLRPPLETPLAKPESPSIKVGWWSSREEANSPPGTIRSIQQTEINSHTMENMVASILLSLQLTEADHQVQDMAQAAEPWADLFDKSDIFPVALAQGNQCAAPLDDADNSLNQLFEGMALNEAIPLSSEMHVPEQNAGTAVSYASHSRKAASGWGWRVLGECMATVLLALYWPGAIWPQTPQLAKSQKKQPIDVR
jgi:hypothetical protein